MIVSKNFKKFDFSSTKTEDTKIDLIKDFEHNYIIVENGELISSNFLILKIKIKLRLKNFEIKVIQIKKTNSLIASKSRFIGKMVTFYKLMRIISLKKF